jgi:hypothetical protein
VDGLAGKGECLLAGGVGLGEDGLGLSCKVIKGICIAGHGALLWGVLGEDRYRRVKQAPERVLTDGKVF